jgi:hypothetical protein
MTARDMKDFTAVKRSLSVEVNFDRILAKHGDVVDDLLVLMHLADISDLKLVEFVSRRCWMRKPPKDEINR